MAAFAKSLAASILGADPLNLQNDISSIISEGVNWIHIDVMDAHFVPNLAYSPRIVREIKKKFDAFLDCHLMVENPLEVIDLFISAGADSITVHYETIQNGQFNEIISKIKNSPQKPKIAIAINPKTDLDENLISFITQNPKIQMITVMTVEPGFGGQSLIEDCLKKAQILRNFFPKMRIQIDGGVNGSNIDRVCKSGADVFVSGSFLFARKENLKRLMKTIQVD